MDDFLGSSPISGNLLKMEPLIALWKTLLAPSVPDPSPFFAAGPSSVASPGAAETWKNKA